MKYKNKIVYIYVGPPASGKSTEAINFINKNPNTVRVNRDLFRHMLRNEAMCEIKIESLITELMNISIVGSLMKGCDVIVDATNLKQKRIKHIIELVKYRADVQFRVFDVPLKTCLERDSLRKEQVGEKVLKLMYNDFEIIKDSGDLIYNNLTKRFAYEDRFVPRIQDKSLPEAVIFDLDGNISLLGKRSEYGHDVSSDIPNDIVIEQIEFAKFKNRKILLVSGREELARKTTIEWCEFYGVEYDELYMRPTGDVRKDYVIKKEIYLEQLESKYNIVSVFDDRISVVEKCWHELGLFCFCTNQGLKIF